LSACDRHEYTTEMGGTLDAENTRTLTTNNCYITFQNNLALVIENTGEALVDRRPVKVAVRQRRPSGPPRASGQNETRPLFLRAALY
jgi:hypothetical protein